MRRRSHARARGAACAGGRVRSGRRGQGHGAVAMRRSRPVADARIVRPAGRCGAPVTSGQASTRGCARSVRRVWPSIPTRVPRGPGGGWAADGRRMGGGWAVERAVERARHRRRVRRIAPCHARGRRRPRARDVVRRARQESATGGRCVGVWTGGSRVVAGRAPGHPRCHGAHRSRPGFRVREGLPRASVPQAPGPNTARHSARPAARSGASVSGGNSVGCSSRRARCWARRSSR